MDSKIADFLIHLADQPFDAEQPELDEAAGRAGLDEAQRCLLRGRRASEIQRVMERGRSAAEVATPKAVGQRSSRGKGELVIVGTGIKGVHDIGRETAALIRDADKVLYVVADPVCRRWICGLNQTAEDLASLYTADLPRLHTYRLMSERILTHVRDGKRVCAVFYGHPGVFVKPSHLALRTARREGYRAAMRPAVSALDCLFADLDVDPSTHSCQIFGATDLLIHGRVIDSTASVVIYQAACVGDSGYYGGGFDLRNVPVLTEYLLRSYQPQHDVFLYEAAQIAVCNPRVERIPLENLPSTKMSGATTLYLPPARRAAVDMAMVQRLQKSASRSKS